MTALNEFFGPHELGDPAVFSIRVELDANHGGAWLFGKVCYVVANHVYGDYQLGTSLRDVLTIMRQIVLDGHTRQNEDFEPLTCDEAFQRFTKTLYGPNNTGLETRAVEEAWAKHDVTLGLDVFQGYRILQFDAHDKTRLICGVRSDDNRWHLTETQVPLGTTGLVFRKFYDLLTRLEKWQESVCGDSQ